MDLILVGSNRSKTVATILKRVYCISRMKYVRSSTRNKHKHAGKASSKSSKAMVLTWPSFQTCHWSLLILRIPLPLGDSPLLVLSKGKYHTTLLSVITTSLIGCIPQFLSSQKPLLEDLDDTYYEDLEMKTFIEIHILLLFLTQRTRHPQKWRNETKVRIEDFPFDGTELCSSKTSEVLIKMRRAKTASCTKQELLTITDWI